MDKEGKENRKLLGYYRGQKPVANRIPDRLCKSSVVYFANEAPRVEDPGSIPGGQKSVRRD